MPDVRVFFEALDDARFDAVEAVRSTDAHGGTWQSGTAVAGWAQHVRRLDDQLDLDPTAREAWGEHDVVAALLIRSRLEGLLGAAPGLTRALVESRVAAADALFREMTVADTGHLLDAVSGDRPDDPRWWWGRVPVRGPAREGLERFAADAARAADPGGLR